MASIPGMQRVRRAIKPFASLRKIIDAVQPPLLSGRPLREMMPGQWPTYDELCELVDAIDGLGKVKP